MEKSMKASRHVAINKDCVAVTIGKNQTSFVSAMAVVRQNQSDN